MTGDKDVERGKRSPTDPRIRRILNAINPGDRVLDVGCVQPNGDIHDPDWLHGQLCEYAAEVVGIDTDRKGISLMQDHGYDVRYCDVECYSAEWAYDAVVAGEVIEHVSNPGRMLQSLRTALRPDSRLLITTPNPWCIARLKRLLYADAIPHNSEHTMLFDTTTLGELLDRHGYDYQMDYVGPRCRGLSRLVFGSRLPRTDRLGGTQLFVEATPGDSR